MEAADLFSAVVGLAGVVVGWLLASRTATRVSEVEREERLRSELLAAIVVYWHELERLEDELRQLPHERDRARASRSRNPLLARLMRAMFAIEAVQAARWIWGLVLRRVFAREALDALEAFKRTSRPLLFVGTPMIQKLVGDAVVLVGESPRELDWWLKWEQTKLQLLETARNEFGGLSESAQLLREMPELAEN